MSMKYRIELVKETGTPDVRNAGKIDVPFLPRVGEYVSHEPSGLSGTVKAVTFWWPEKGPLHIEVRLSK